MPEGSVMTVEFELEGFKFIALNGGPLFKFTPAVSFFLNFDPSRDQKAREHIDAMWEKLAAGGTALMPLDKYPFSERYGWIQDKYGVSWQLILSNPEGEQRPFIVPSLLFVGDVAGRAEEAIDFYTSVYRNSKRGATARYGKDQSPDKEGTLMFADFMIENQWFAAMDSAYDHKFTFNEAISLMVECKEPGGDRPPLAEAYRRRRRTALRLAEGQIRRFLADRFQRDERDPPGPRPGKAGNGNEGLLPDEEDRHRCVGKGSGEK